MISTFEGAMGQFKTAGSVALSYLDFVHYKKKVIANIHLNFPYTHFDHEYFLEHIKLKDLELNDSDTILDEAQQVLDARRSGGKLNILYGYYVVQTRKRDVDLYATFHNIDVMDKRFVRQVDNRGTCRYQKESPCKLCGGTGHSEKKDVTCPNCSGSFTTFVPVTSYGNYGAVSTSKIPFPIFRQYDDTTVDCLQCKGTGLVCPRCLGSRKGEKNPTENGTGTVRFLNWTTGARKRLVFWGPSVFNLYNTSEMIEFTGKQIKISVEDL